MSTMELNVDIVNEDQITADLDARIRRLLCTCFPADVGTFSLTRHWNGCAPAYSVVQMTDGVVFGHIGIVLREILVGGSPVMVAGVQNFAVSPERRGTGLSQRLESAAMDEARRRDVRFGVLFCVPKLERLYSSMGWTTSNAKVTMLDAQGQSVPGCSKSIMMVKQLGDEPSPAGDVDLQGRDW
jgi:predicted N-acetyltransferase YhbS